jgi:transposase
VLSGEASSVPKSDEDRVGMIRTLRVARRSAVHSTTQIVNQIHSLLVTAPADLREQLRSLTGRSLIETLAAFRPGPITTPTAAAKMALRVLARRHQHLGDEIATLNVELERLTQEVAPELCALKGVGPDVAGALLVAAGDNPDRLRSEASFAQLCGVAPLQAHPARRPAAIGSTAAATGRPTTPSGASSSVASGGITRAGTTWPAEPPRASPRRRSSAASQALRRT